MLFVKNRTEVHGPAIHGRLEERGAPLCRQAARTVQK